MDAIGSTKFLQLNPRSKSADNDSIVGWDGTTLNPRACREFLVILQAATDARKLLAPDGKLHIHTVVERYDGIVLNK